MKKNKILAYCLSVITAFTAVFASSCGKAPGGNNSVTPTPGGDKVGSSEDRTVIDVVKSESSVPVSGYNIVENGKSDYRIVISTDADDNVVFAANELKTYIRYSTGAELPIETDGESFSETEKVISLGDTSIYRGALAQDESLALTDDLGLTGYVLKREGKTLIINAKDGNGVFCGVYDMLGDTIGLVNYAYDEIYYREMQTMPLLDFNEHFVPSFDVRDMTGLSLTSVYKRKMKFYSQLGKGIWATFAHTVETVYLPVEEYMDAHPEYYGNTGGTQVCYSNAEMRKEMVKKMKTWIEGYPEARYIMVGHEDNTNMCTCDNCVAERELYGNYGGQELHFTNLIAEELDPWMKQNYPDREMYYVFFAYQTSQQPPIKTTVDASGNEVAVLDKDGKYQPYYDGFEIHEKVRLMYCPIDADFSAPITAESNTTQYEQLRGWKDLFDYAGYEGKSNIIVWAYSLACLNYWVPQDNIGAYKQQYAFYKDSGIGYLYDQANSTSAIFSFESLRIYTQSQLMYDNSQDYNELAMDFINHYYGEGAENIAGLYNFIRSYYEYMEETKGLNGNIKYEHGADPAFWPMEVIDTMMDFCDKALEAIEPLRESDPIRFNTLNNRIRRERLMPIFLMFRHHISEVPLDKKEEYYNDMVTISRLYNVVEERESGTSMEVNFETWYAQLFNS